MKLPLCRISVQVCIGCCPGLHGWAGRREAYYVYVSVVSRSKKNCIVCSASLTVVPSYYDNRGRVSHSREASGSRL